MECNKIPNEVVVKIGQNNPEIDRTSSFGTPSHMKNIASVLLDVSIHEALDYQIPEELKEDLHFGSLVAVPLKGQMRKGWVMGFKEKSPFPNIKPIQRVLSKEPSFTQEILDLAVWMSAYYVTPLTKVLKTMIPSSLRKEVKPKMISYVERIKTKKELQDGIRERTRSEAQMRVLELLLKAPKEILLTELLEKAEATQSSIHTLEKKGFLKIVKTPINRSFVDGEFFRTKPKPLHKEQQETYEKIIQSLDKGIFQTHLIYGITGSGKTEVYMQAIEHALKQEGGVLMMVPEISLTTQIIDQFRGRFKENIALLHHRLSNGERFDAWHSLRLGKTKIALGARSSVFAPIKNLKLIIVDEEHEASYKQTEEMPCYHARDVAVMRGKKEGAVVILGSATPSIESYYNAINKKYTLSVLQTRVGKSSLPKVTIVDMRREYEKNKGRVLFSEELLSQILKRKHKGEQSILFLNRRGYHTACLCLSCGKMIECKSCASSLTYHKKETLLSCHRCGFSLSPPPTKCPSCHSLDLKFKGVGTEQVEKALKAIDPEIRTLRMDADTTRHRGSHERLFKEFATQKADVLIGTQMIAKGLHFPLVTLVGILNADQALQFPDYKAEESTFQMITQVSGRAGRSFHQGEVIIQTSLIDHPLLKLASQQNYEAFYQYEILTREMFSFPPLKLMAKIRFSGRDERKTESAAARYREQLISYIPKDFHVMPLSQAGHFKLKDRFFYHFFLLGKSLEPVRLALKTMEKGFLHKSSLGVHIDINPISTYF